MSLLSRTHGSEREESPVEVLAVTRRVEAPLLDWPKALMWITAITSFWYVLSRFLPCTHPSQYTLQDGIDDAWAWALHVDFVNHLQFGRDVVFTYGPWGFLSRGYTPETHWIAMLAWAVLSLILWMAAWRLANHFTSNCIIAWGWVIAFSAAATLPRGDDINARLIAWTVLPLLLHFFVEDGKFTPLQAAMAACWGLLSLTKFTGAIEGIAIFAIIGLHDLCRRRIPWGLIVLATSVLLFWVLAHQRLSSIVPYVINSLRITSGYTDAMMTRRPSELTQVFWFIALAGILLTLACIISWKQLKRAGALVIVALSVILVLCFKAAFVQTNTVHLISGGMGLLLIALGVMSIAWRNHTLGTGLASVLLLLACTLWTSNVFKWNFGELGLLKQAADTLSPRSLSAPFVATFSDPLEQLHTADCQLFRTQRPLPLVSGSSDLYTVNLSVLFAHGLKYSPRPVPQSYSAYSPELSELNAAFLRSPGAPDNLFFNLYTLHSKYPAMDDSRSWPTLLTRYDVKGMTFTNGYLLMQRAAHPRSFSLDAATNTIASFGTPTAVPDTSDGPIWVEVDFTKSFGGKLQTLLYKPQELTMTITTRNHNRHTFRIVEGMTRGGFLLSPCILNTESFGWLAYTGGRTGPDEMIVTSVEFGTHSQPNTCYQSEIAVRFYRLQFQPQQSLTGEQTVK